MCEPLVAFPIQNMSLINGGVMGHWIVDRLGTVDPKNGWGEWPFVNSVPGPLLKISNASVVQCPLAGGQGVGLFLYPKADLFPETLGCVLFLHDLGHDATSGYWLFYEDFLRLGCAVLAINWDGHGKPCASDLDFQLSTRSISLILQRLSGVPQFPFFLSGHGVGSTIVLSSASREDVFQLIRGILVSAPILFPVTPFQLTMETLSNLYPWTLYKKFVSLLNRIGCFGAFKALNAYRIFGNQLSVRVGLKRHIQLSDYVTNIFFEGELLRKIKNPILWVSPGKSLLVSNKLALTAFSQISHGLFFVHDCNINHCSAAWSHGFRSAVFVLSEWMKQAK